MDAGFRGVSQIQGRVFSPVVAAPSVTLCLFVTLFHTICVLKIFGTDFFCMQFAYAYESLCLNTHISKSL